MDDRRNYVKRAAVQGFFDQILGDEQNIPEDTGRFRNVVPQAAEDMVKTVQHAVWENRIDLPALKKKKIAS